jgi:hypothetical protein
MGEIFAGILFLLLLLHMLAMQFLEAVKLNNSWGKLKNDDNSQNFCKHGHYHLLWSMKMYLFCPRKSW